MSEPRVLIVDDSKLVRSLTGRVLSENGMIVETAEDGRQGCQKVFEFQPDVILIDLTLPPRTGPSFKLDSDRTRRGLIYGQETLYARRDHLQVAIEGCRQIGVTEQTYYRWRKEYGGLDVIQAKRLKDLEKENARLKRLVADQALDMEILKEANRGNF
jgi:CheY-like chemotaxis protein